MPSTSAAPPPLPDLTGAALAIAAGARLSVGPSSGLATRAPSGMRGDEARRFIDAARATLRPVLARPDARAALLRILAPWPHGWGEVYGCAVVALLWAPTLTRLPSPLPLRRGHVAPDAARYVAALRLEILTGPTWQDRHGTLRWAARLHTGALHEDLEDLDAAFDGIARADGGPVPASTAHTASAPHPTADA